MTVSKLIEQLQEHPPEMEVLNSVNSEPIKDTDLRVDTLHLVESHGTIRWLPECVVIEGHDKIHETKTVLPISPLGPMSDSSYPMSVFFSFKGANFFHLKVGELLTKAEFETLQKVIALAEDGLTKPAECGEFKPLKPEGTE